MIKDHVSKINIFRFFLLSLVSVHLLFLHQVNEEGTEAAAATGVLVVKLSAQIPREIIVDHPFLFLIR